MDTGTRELDEDLLLAIVESRCPRCGYDLDEDGFCCMCGYCLHCDAVIGEDPVPPVTMLPASSRP